MDSPARLTPYELVFGDAVFKTARFAAIRAEAETRGSADVELADFPFLSAVGELLGELLPENASAVAYTETAAFLFHAFRFWLHGKRLLVLHPEVARHSVDRAFPAGPWRLVVPAPAGYLQLPRHLFWARVAASGLPEAVDGFFWYLAPRTSSAGAAGAEGAEGVPGATGSEGSGSSATGEVESGGAAGVEGTEGAAGAAVTTGALEPAVDSGGRLEVLLVLGLRGDRPGLSTIRIGADPTAVESGHWCDVEGRPGGEDFANVLPGGELEGLYSLLTETEVLKLVSRCFRYVDRWPSAQAVVEPAASVASEPAEQAGEQAGQAAGEQAGQAGIEPAGEVARGEAVGRGPAKSEFALPASALRHTVVLPVPETGPARER